MIGPELNAFILPEMIRTMSSLSGSRPTLRTRRVSLTFWNILPFVGVRSSLSRQYPVRYGAHSFRYPIRDPFFKMLPRSLSNFMNAFTSSDFTSYPFATTNKTDFRNLISVYLDATLKPLLQKHDFLQEGWRIGPENPVKKSEVSPAEIEKLVFKGVVYNEMKGQMSDTSYLYYIKFQESIFPDIKNSGGDPSKMTSLTYENLKDFHGKHYHPSNAKIFTYGDTPLEDHLVDIGADLDRFQKSTSDLRIMEPISLANGPLEKTVKGPMDALMDPDHQHKTSVTWLAGDASDVIESFALRIVSSLLLEGYGSPMYRDLVEAGLGTDWSPNTGFDHAGTKGLFSIGLTGVKKEDLSNIRTVIESTLRRVFDEGFDVRKVEGIFHQLELALKHKTADFGMGIMQRLQPGWFNGVHPFETLGMYDAIEELKSKLQSGRYLESLVQKYLLSDKMFIFSMEPSSSYAEGLAEEETSRLTRQVQEIDQQGSTTDSSFEIANRLELDLLRDQEMAKDQDLSCLPSVHVDDIPRQAERKLFRHSVTNNVKTQWRETATNGLTYFRAVNLLSGLPTELRLLLPLFTDCLMRLGTKTKSMEELEDLIRLRTGGISIGYFSSNSPTDINQVFEGISLSGYALDCNVSIMYELMRILLYETNFDGPEAESKIRQLLQGYTSNALNAIAGSGHSYARRYAEASLSPEGILKEQTAGLTQVAYNTSLAAHASSEGGLADSVAKLKAIQKFAISRSSNIRTAITCGPESTNSNESALQSFLSSLPSPSSIPSYTSSTHFPLPLTPPSSPQTLFPFPFQITHTALSLPTTPYISPSSPALQLLGQLLTHKHLHSEVREKGGAYGGGAYSRPLSGTFGYYSYRDPNPVNTLKVMQDAGKVALERKWTAQDLEEAKISVFQGVDAPEAVNEEGMRGFLSGVDEGMEQIRRERLLDCGVNEIRDVAERFLVGGADKAITVVLGEAKGLKEADWEVRRLQMPQGEV